MDQQPHPRPDGAPPTKRRRIHRRTTRVAEPAQAVSAHADRAATDARYMWAFAPAPEDAAPATIAASSPTDVDTRFAWAFGLTPDPATANAPDRAQRTDVTPTDRRSTPRQPDEQRGLGRWLPRRRTAAAPTDTADPASEHAADAPTGPLNTVRAVEPHANPSPADGQAGPEHSEQAATHPAPNDDVSPSATSSADDHISDVDFSGETNPARLRRRRKHLIGDRELALYHLGGLAFELHRRALLTGDVLRRRAELVSSIDEAVRALDERLVEIDTHRRDRRSPDARPADVGCCIACRTPFATEARFCWSCGARLNPPDEALEDQLTSMIHRDGR